MLGFAGEGDGVAVFIADRAVRRLRFIEGGLGSDAPEHVSAAFAAVQFGRAEQPEQAVFGEGRGHAASVAAVDAARRYGVAAGRGRGARHAVAPLVVDGRRRPADRIGLALGGRAQPVRHLRGVHVGTRLFRQRRQARREWRGLAGAAEAPLAEGGGHGFRHADHVGLGSAVRAGAPAAVRRHVVGVGEGRGAHGDEGGVGAVRRAAYGVGAVRVMLQRRRAAAELAKLNPRRVRPRRMARDELVAARARRRERDSLVWNVSRRPRLVILGAPDDVVERVEQVEVDVAVRAAPVVVPAHLEYVRPAAWEVEVVGLVAGCEVEYAVVVRVSVRDGSCVVAVGVRTAPGRADVVAGGVYPRNAGGRGFVDRRARGVGYERRAVRGAVPSEVLGHAHDVDVLLDKPVDGGVEGAGGGSAREVYARVRRYVVYRFARARSVSGGCRGYVGAQAVVRLAGGAELAGGRGDFHADERLPAPEAAVYDPDLHARAVRALPALEVDVRYGVRALFILRVERHADGEIAGGRRDCVGDFERIGAGGQANRIRRPVGRRFAHALDDGVDADCVAGVGRDTQAGRRHGVGGQVGARRLAKRERVAMGVAAVDVRRVRRARRRPRPGARERAARRVERPKRRYAAARGRLDGRELHA